MCAFTLVILGSCRKVYKRGRGFSRWFHLLHWCILQISTASCFPRCIRVSPTWTFLEVRSYNQVHRHSSGQSLHSKWGCPFNQWGVRGGLWVNHVNTLAHLCISLSKETLEVKHIFLIHITFFVLGKKGEVSTVLAKGWQGGYGRDIYR